MVRKQGDVQSFGFFESRKLVAYRYCNSLPPEKIRIHLYSCNPKGIEANVVLAFVNHRDAQRNVSSEGKALLHF